MRNPHQDNEVRIFLSYSRAQFYFAESLAHALAARDVVVWFDSQQLTTGEDWAAEIMRGLQASPVLVLVGSEQALASAAVRQEWTTALSQGKKVVVAMFEYVELPTELAASVVVDFRRSFGAALARLESVLRGKVAPEAGNVSNRRRVLAPAVRVIAWSLAVPAGVALFVIGLIVTQLPDAENVAASVALCGYIGFMCVFLIQRKRAFIRRSFRRSQTQVALIISGAILPLAIGRALSVSELPPTLVLTTVLLLAGSLVLALVGSWQLQRNPAIFRWLPTGEARASERTRNAGVRSIANAAHQQSHGNSPKFWLRFDTGDRYVAGIVERQFARAGWEKALTQEAADRHLVLVSAETDLAQIVSGYQSGLPPVVIVTSNGVRESILGGLARHQWIDFRRRRLRDLRQAGMQLRAGDSITPSIELNAVPERLWDPVQPFHMQLALRLVYMTCLVLTVLVMILMFVHALRAFLAIFSPAEAQELQATLQSAFDNVQNFVPPGLRDVQTQMGLGFISMMFFSPIAAVLVAAMMVSVVAGLAWFANAVVARKLSHRAALITGGVLSLGLLGMLYPVIPFVELLGLVGLVLLIGEKRHAWLPAATQAFRKRAIDAFMDRAGWRRTANAVGLLFALLFVGLGFLMSFA
jgi:hypothetical protein